MVGFKYMWQWNNGVKQKNSQVSLHGKARVQLDIKDVSICRMRKYGVLKTINNLSRDQPAAKARALRLHAPPCCCDGSIQRRQIVSMCGAEERGHSHR